jgi:hypothetical protein
MQPVKFGSHSISHNEALRPYLREKSAGSDVSSLGDHIDRAEISLSNPDGLGAPAKKPSFPKGESTSSVVESTRSAWRSLATATMIALSAASLGGLTGCASVATQHSQQQAPRDPAYEVGRELNKAGKEIGKAGKEIGEAGKQIGLGAWEVGKSFWKGISGQPQEAPAKPAPPPAPPAKKR